MKRARILLIVIILLVVGACGDDEVTVPRLAGRLTVTITGLPADVQALATLTNAEGTEVALPATTRFDLFPPGTYQLRAAPTSAGFSDYHPTNAVQVIEVRAGEATSAVVEYVGVVARGALYVEAGGLPAGAVPTFEVTDPNGFATTITGPDTLSGLSPGSYTVSGQDLDADDEVYRAWPESETAAVVAGAYTPIFFTFGATSDASLDLSIGAVELTQVTQRDDGTVPLVAGRAAYLRIYGLASEANQVSPPVRVDWYVDDVFFQTEVVTREAASTPGAVSRLSLDGSWNLRVPADMVTSGLSFRVTIDPDGEVPEADETNNIWPGTGMLAPVDVVWRSFLPMRLVPVHQSANGLIGDATTANAEGYVSDLATLTPVPGVDVDVRATYTTSAPPLQADNGNGAWSQILSEILGLRQVEDHGDRHYYGVVRCQYSSGIAGLGQIAGFAAIGWDAPGSRAGVLAHEVGHNLGLYHAPCGGPSGVDPNFPYAEALIGAWGFDVDAEMVHDPSVDHDFMSYCNPKWISDYNYDRLLGSMAADAGIDREPTTCLLVWGRLVAGRLHLDPALVIDARPSVPERPGPYRLRALDPAGREVVATSFALPEVGDLPPGHGAFAWTLPLPAAKAGTIETLALSGDGQRIVLERSAAAKSGRRPRPSRLTRSGDLRLDWDASAHPLVLVRRHDDGDVVAIVRGGTASIRTAPGELDLWFSDGVRGDRLRVTAP